MDSISFYPAESWETGKRCDRTNRRGTAKGLETGNNAVSRKQAQPPLSMCLCSNGLGIHFAAKHILSLQRAKSLPETDSAILDSFLFYLHILN